MMKMEIAKASVLAYYKPKKQTELQTDESIKGLGACLLQEEWPFYFASKALTEAPQRIHCHRIRVISNCMGHGEVPPLPVCKSLHIRNRLEAFGNNLVQKFKSSHPQIAEDFN